MSELTTTNLENAVVDTEIFLQNCTNNSETCLDNTLGDHETIQETTSSVQEQSVEIAKTLEEEQNSVCLFRENEPKVVTMKELLLERLSGCHVLEHIIKDCPEIDTVISCANGKVGAHRVVLASASPFLKMLLSDHIAGEVVTLVLPDFLLETVTSILTLCYTGTMEVSLNSEGVNEVVQSAMIALMIGFPNPKFSVRKIKQETPPIPKVKEEPELNVHGVDPENHGNQLHAPLSTPEIAENGEQELIKKTYPETCINDDTIESTTSLRPKSTTTRRIQRGRPRCTVAKGTPSVGSSGSKRGRKPGVVSKRNVKKEKNQDVSKEDKDIKHNTVERVESPVCENGKGEEIKAFIGISLLKDEKYVCLECKGIVRTQEEFKKHLCYQHGSTLNSTEVSSEEIESLVKCDICFRKCSGVQGASECLEAHGFVKCFTCFGLILTDDLYQHYTAVHGVHTTFARVAKCRWCDLAVAIGDDGQHPQNHVLTAHIEPFLNSNTKHFQLDQIQGELNSSIISDKESNLKENSEESLTTSVQNIQNHDTNPIMKRNYDDEETFDEAPSPKKRKLDDQGNPLQLSKRTGVPSLKSPQRTFLETFINNVSTQPPSFTTAATTGKIMDLDLSKLDIAKICLDIMNEVKVRKLSESDDSCSTLPNAENSAI